jgi:ParG
VSPLQEKKKVKRMNLNVESSLHDRFKAAVAVQGKDMTTVLLAYIRRYVDEHGVAPAAPKKKTGRR